MHGAATAVADTTKTLRTLCPYEMDAWLGPARDEMTDEQAKRFTAGLELISTRYPEPDDQMERDAATSATVQCILGETTVQEQARNLRDARIHTATTMAAAQQVARLAVRDGAPKATTACQIGLDRMTMRKVLGK